MSDHRTPAELEVEIARQRDELAQTVDQLTHKLDVKAQAKERAAQVADRATTDDGRPRPELVAAAVDHRAADRRPRLVAATMSRSARSGESRTQDRTPDVDDDRKPDSPTDLTDGPGATCCAGRVREFGDDQCTDLAAALTYYAVLALFPAAIALIALLGLVGQGQSSVDNVLEVLQPLVSSSTLDTIQPALESSPSRSGRVSAS